MEFRSAFPVAILLGGTLGVAAVTAISPAAEGETPRFVSEASATAVGVQWDLPVVLNEPVLRFVTMFSEKQSDRMALYLKRSGRYEGMIRAKLRARGMPEDLFYLSMIESGFNPTARSKAQAVGLWQFIEETGERYGLRVDRYVDERRDPEKSTDAALSYLQDLHSQFGSWYLAAAAYNTGEGRVARIMREETGSERGVESDFWRIRERLPRETEDYVPLMMAAVVVGKQPDRYGLGDVERYLPITTETVLVPGETRLSVVAEAVGVSAEEIEDLNPQLVREMTPPGDAYAVRVPEERAAAFAANFSRPGSRGAVDERADTESEPRAAERTHRVRSGESLWTIARRHDITVAQLKRANGLGKRNTIRPGQTLNIPT